MTIRRLFPLLFAAVVAAAWIPESAAAQCVDCSPCIKNQQLGNKAPMGDATSVSIVGRGSHPHCVATGGCMAQHPPDCWPSEEQQAAFNAVLVDIVAAIRADDSQTLTRALTDGGFHGRIVYVSNRRAIQALGCNDAVVAHFPLRTGSNVLASVMSAQNLTTVAPNSF